MYFIKLYILFILMIFGYLFCKITSANVWKVQKFDSGLEVDICFQIFVKEQAFDQQF